MWPLLCHIEIDGVNCGVRPEFSVCHNKIKVNLIKYPIYDGQFGILFVSHMGMHINL